jgi:putative transposase
MSSFNGWVTAKEITELPGFSSAVSTILRKAKNEQWTCRKREGVKGIAYEFLIESLPHDMQSAIREKVYQTVLASKPGEHALRAVVARKATADRQDIALLRQCPVILEQKVGD